MVEVILASVLVETITEKAKELGLTGVSGWLSLVVGFGVAFATSLQLVPVDIINNEIVNIAISGLILSGGANYANSVRDKLKGN